MEGMLQDISLIGAASLAITVLIVSAFLRMIIEFAFPQLKKLEARAKKQKLVEYQSSLSRFYNELLLYALPYIVISIVVIPKIEFVFGASSSFDQYLARWIFGMSVTPFSTLIFKAVKKSLPKFFGVKMEKADRLLDVPLNLTRE